MELNQYAQKYLLVSISTEQCISTTRATAFSQDVANRFKFIFYHLKGVDWTVNWTYENSRHEYYEKLDNFNWETIENKQLSRLWIIGMIEVDEIGERLLEVIVYYSPLPDVANALEFSLAVTTGELPITIQRQVVALTLDTFVKNNGLTGYITLEEYIVADGLIGRASPYEFNWSIKYQDAAQHFGNKVRGCYWGNLMRKQHFELLGDKITVFQSRFFRIEEIAEGYYYLQVTEDMNNFDLEGWPELEEIFAPILPPHQSNISRKELEKKMWAVTNENIEGASDESGLLPQI